MANRLNYNDLLKYMEIVLDMEKNVYVELKSWQDLQAKIKRLGIAKNYEKPKDFDGGLTGLGCSGIFLTIIFSMFLGGSVYFILRLIGGALWLFTRQQNTITPTMALIIGGLITIVIILIVIIRSIMEQKAYKENCEKDINIYNQNVKNDNVRVQKELAQKQYLQTQADTLASMWRTSKKKLAKMYSFLEEKYRNIVAVASFDGWTTELSRVTENVSYIAKYKATQTGFQIKVTDYTKKAVLSVDTEKYYRGTVNFTVEAKKACVVALKKADGSYERLYCTTTDDNKNFFTVTVTNADVEIYMTYKGDANLDGKVNTKDTSHISKASSNKIKLVDFSKLAADLYRDNKINTRDVTQISKLVSNKISYDWDSIS